MNNIPSIHLRHSGAGRRACPAKHVLGNPGHHCTINMHERFMRQMFLKAFDMQSLFNTHSSAIRSWIPAFAGMTGALLLPEIEL
jgi:hypothetical protein